MRWSVLTEKADPPLVKRFKGPAALRPLSGCRGSVGPPPGLASAACSALDSMRIDTLVGTLAGDDTAFLLMKDNTSADEFFHEIEKLL